MEETSKTNETAQFEIDAISIRSISEIIEKIQFYKLELKRYEQLTKDYPNDFDFKREMYGYACKIFSLEWVLLSKNGN